ncbi:MAG: hypothetical protein COA58_05685 [Bacteroidetes bacterium]|nr:MAG: hypothetical protein COA58_05685 [Bacteroidota bacterium]
MGIRRILILYIAVLCFGIGHAQIWKSIGNGIPSNPTVITTTPKFIATAHILSSTAESRSYAVRVWNGNYWLTLPIITLNPKGSISSLKFYNNALYIAGDFDTLNGIDSSKNIVKWTSGEFTSVPNLWRNLNDYAFIKGLTIYQNKLLVHGSFHHPSGSFGSGLLAYNGNEVVPMSTGFGSGIVGNIYSINADYNILVMGGRFTKANGAITKQLAYFKDGTWTRITNNVIIPFKVITYKENIYFYGSELGGENYGFYVVDGTNIDTLKNGLARIDKIYDFVNIDGILYASGLFELENTDEEHRLIRWKNGIWEAVQNGNLLGITKLTNQNDQLLAAGHFGSYLNIELPLNHIGRYVENAGIAIGQVFFDKDKNCEFDKRDEQLNNMAVQILPSGEIIKPRENGKFYAVLGEGSYTFKILRNKNWHANNACNGDEIKVTISKGQINDSVKFSMLQNVGTRDLKIQLSAFTGQSAVNNSANSYKLTYSNVGSVDIGETKVVLKFNEKFSGLSAKPEPDKIEGDSAIWIVKDFFAGEIRDIVCSFNISTQDTEIELEASIELQEEEEDILDNKSKLSQILGQEDFEFKKYVLPGNGSDTTTISPITSKIGYQISFKNYTNDTVRTVYVIDTIGLNHSMSYIQEVGGSHPYTTAIYPGLPGTDIGILVYTFNNIDLHPNPEKYSDKVASFGYISFEIGLASGLNDGIMLSNKAHVVFDYYEQEETNRVFALVDADLLSTKTIERSDLKVYPNPTTNILNVDLPDFIMSFDYSITSISGQQIGTSSSTTKSIDVSGLSNGVYFMEIVSNDVSYRTRFVKN